MRRNRILTALLLMAALLLGGMAAGATDGALPEGGARDVSESDLLADFVRVPLVPINVEIPEFYREVGNIAGMYIFTMPDGTVEKRIYGSIDDVFGWYVPVGADNLIYRDAKPIDVAEDVERYYAAYKAAGIDLSEDEAFTGLLPPEERVAGVTEVFGYPIRGVFMICAAAASLLCIIILIASRSGRRR